MKGKLNKIFVVLLGAFLLVGGLAFSACNKKTVQATIAVSSQSFKSEDYIEFDMNSDNTEAEIIASVKNASSGEVTVNNENQDKVFVSSTYNADNGQTKITLKAKSEGEATIVLRSHNRGEKIISIYIYSDILGLEQKKDGVDDNGQILPKTQFVVRGESTPLSSDRYLKFTSREGGESNRKDVTWSLVTQSEFVHINDGNLLVDNDYQGENGEDTVTLLAESNFTDFSTQVVLDVINPLPQVRSAFSRRLGSYDENVDKQFNLVKNDDFNSEASLYVQLTANVNEEIVVTPVVKVDGREVDGRLQFLQIGDGIGTAQNTVVYQIVALSSELDNESLEVCFSIRYAEYDLYTVETTLFTINLVDVIDEISIVSRGEDIATGSTIALYDKYQTDNTVISGRPFQIQLGPASVSNDNAQFFIQVSLPAGITNVGDCILVAKEHPDESGDPYVKFEQIREGVSTYYKSELLPNNSVLYFLAKEGYQTTSAITFEFISDQSRDVKSRINFECYKAPKSDFELETGETEAYMSTNVLGNMHKFTVSSAGLVGINVRDITYRRENGSSANFDISGFGFNSESGTIELTITNNKANLNGDTIRIYFIHANGFRSVQSIQLTAYTELTNASVMLQGASAASASAYDTAEQNFATKNFENGDRSLEYVIARTGPSLGLSIESNNSSAYTVKFVDKGVLNDFDISQNWRDAQGLDLERLINVLGQAEGSTKVSYAGGSVALDVDFQGLVFVKFSGKDEKYSDISLYRIFYLEAYTTPSSLMPDTESVSRIAQNSVSSQESYLARAHVTVNYRIDSKAITYYGNSVPDPSTFVMYSQNTFLEKGYFDRGTMNFLQKSEVNGKTEYTIKNINKYYHIEEFNVGSQRLSFDIIADSTDGYDEWNDQIIIQYEIYNRLYTGIVNLHIENAQRIELVEWRNFPQDNIIYLDKNSEYEVDQRFLIVTNVKPFNARNSKLRYDFVADDGTESTLVEISDLGLVTFNQRAVRGGTGYIYVYPDDSIISKDQTQMLVYYTDAEDGSMIEHTVQVSDIAKEYDNIIQGYFFKRENSEIVKIDYSDVLLKIRIVVADGATEQTATRIYNAEQIRNMNLSNHYILMRSVTLDNYIAHSSSTLLGSFKGYDDQVTLTFANGSKALFGTIGDGAKVENLRFNGAVEDAGFVASINKGLINNVTITVTTLTDKTNPTSITSSSQFAGAVVGQNEGEITYVTVEGVGITSTFDGDGYIGGIAGLNKGTISHSNVQFYLFEGEKDGVVNKFVGTENSIVGALVGKLDAEGVIESSFAYNYTQNAVFETYKTAGAIVGEAAEGARISESFGLIDAQLAEGETLTLSDAEILKNAELSDVYYSLSPRENEIQNEDKWLKNGEEGYQTYVRSDGDANHPYLKDVYQSQSISDLSIFNVQKFSENGYTKSLAVEKTSQKWGLVYLRELSASTELSEGESAALISLNSITLKDLFNDERALSLVAYSDKPNVVEVSGNTLIIKQVGQVTLTIAAKQNYTKSLQITLKVIHAVDDFTLSYNSVPNPPYNVIVPVQEGRTRTINFGLEQSIYLANNPTPYNLRMDPRSIKSQTTIAEGSVIDLEKIKFTAEDLSGTLIADKGAIKEDGASNDKRTVTLTAWPDIDGIEDDDIQSAIKKANTASLQAIISKGANFISASVDQITIEPAYTAYIDVLLDTDDVAGDGLQFVLMDGEREIAPIQDTTLNAYVFNKIEQQPMLVLKVAKDESYNVANTLKFRLTLNVSDDYRHVISENEEYSLQIRSQSGTATNENLAIGVTLISQPINYIDIANYRSGTDSIDLNTGTRIYSRTDEFVSVLSPGRSSIMQLVLDPEFAHYDHFTLTYARHDEYILGISKLAFYQSNSKQYTYDSNVTTIENGVSVRYDPNANGVYAFRIYVGTNVTQDTQFDIIASFYDRNNNLVTKDPQTYTLYISVLPIAELTINGQAQAAIAKGGTADVKVLLRKDQEVESISMPNAYGVALSEWEEEENSDPAALTKTLSATLTAGLNAGVGQEGQNGEFQMCVVVSRIVNGVREQKTSYVSVIIVSFLPVSASLEGDGVVHDSSLNMDVFEAPNGFDQKLSFRYNFSPESYSYDRTDSAEQALVNSLLDARRKFASQGYYQGSTEGFYINCEPKGDHQPIKLKDRIYINGSKANFQKVAGQGETYSYSGQYFTLTYSEQGTGEDITTSLVVHGLRNTPNPITVEIHDSVYLERVGEAFSYTIPIRFGIDVSDHSTGDAPIVIEDASQFLDVATQGKAQDYILVSDITLENYTPISANMFRSLDGNGFTINIKSFNTTQTGSVELALFTNIPDGTIIKNVKVNYYSGGNINLQVTNGTGDFAINSVSVAGFAINNAGIITNCEVVAYRNSDATLQMGDVGLKVSLRRGDNDYIIADTSVTCQVAGFVISNTGDITNSRVGGKETRHMTPHVESDLQINYYEVITLPNFVISGQGDMAGFVLNNSGHIAASGSAKIQLTNLSALTTTNTSGFVGTNTGEIRTSYIEGVELPEDNNNNYHIKGSNISSRGVVAGFVMQNGSDGAEATTAIIRDCYSNISLNASDPKSRTSAGFVYRNYGGVYTSFTASNVESADMLQLNFSGVDRNGVSLNQGIIEHSYYYIEGYSDDKADDVQKVVENQASLVNTVTSKNSYYGFVFASSLATAAESEQDGVWTIVDKKGVKLVSSTTITFGNRYKANNRDGSYSLLYSTLKNVTTRDTFTGSELGGRYNPILITSAQDFKEAVGESKSTYVARKYDNTSVFGNYRFVSNADFSELNVDMGNGIQGNADLTSITKTFKGSIDGNGFTLQNVSLGTQGVDFKVDKTAGLFAQIDGGIIQNLNIEVQNVTFTNVPVVGTLAGIARDATISNINVTQIAPSSAVESGYGVGGSNVAGGVVGAVFGDTRLNGLTATDIIVIADHSSNEGNGENSTRYLQIFNPALLRTNSASEQFFAKPSNIADSSTIRNFSFAGGIVGYLDSMSAQESRPNNFDYAQNLQNEDYTTRKLLVTGSVDVRGEVVGGVIGYSGVKTKAQDIALVVARNQGGYANILSFNNFAGGLIGYANGQFYQVYAEHEATLQKAIEDQTKAYYQDSSIAAERGILDLFTYTQASTGRFDYNPTYVGGLFGVVGAASLNVAYSKINAINHSSDQSDSSHVSYAGGIAGIVVYPGSHFSVPIPQENNVNATLYMQEVYASGDVYAAHQGGLLGGLKPTGDNYPQLLLISVNAVNHYGIMDNDYDFEEQENDAETATLYTIGGENVEANTTFKLSLTAKTGDQQTDIKKTFGFMTSYTLGPVNAPTKRINVSPYKGYEAYIPNSSPEWKQWIFEMNAISRYADQEAGYSETNGAFIGSRSWDSSNWIHDRDRLYPHINFINSVNYLYLDAYAESITRVLEKMNNSSMEVRVRGLKDPNGTPVFTDVDLRPYLSDTSWQINNFSGRIVGGTSDVDWGFDNFTAISNDYWKDAHYPGVIIGSNSWIDTAAKGVVVESLNIFLDQKGETKPEKGLEAGGYLCASGMENASFVSVSVYVNSPLKMVTSSSAGLLAPELTTSSVLDTKIIFTNKAELTGSDNSFVKVTGATQFGLIAGTITQTSMYQTLRVQNVQIAHPALTNGQYLFTVQSDNDVSAGLYAGLIKETTADGKPSEGTLAKINIELDSPKLYSLADVVEEEGQLTTAMSLMSNSSKASPGATFGGYIGKVEKSNTQLTFALRDNHTLQFDLGIEMKDDTKEEKHTLTLGGLVGEVTSTNSITLSERTVNANVNLLAQGSETSYNNIVAGAVFGKLHTSARLQGNSVEINLVQKQAIGNGSKQATIANLTFGGLIGANEGTLDIKGGEKGDVTVSVSSNDGGLNGESANFAFQNTSPLKASGEVNFGGLIGANSTAVTVEGIKFNNEGKEKVYINGGTLYAGDLVGISTNGTLSATSFNSNSVNKFVAKNANVGGLVGEVDDGSINLGNDTANMVHVQTVDYIEANTVNAGGAVGNFKTSTASTIKGVAYGGAFEFVVGGTLNKEATHHIGGAVGDVSGSNLTLSNNHMYGDAIYTYYKSNTATTDALTEYYFGGLVGKGAGTITMKDNVIAFTNNNPRYSGTYQADALVGNGDGIDTDKETELSSNKYSSQLVLATSEYATDIGYKTNYVEGGYNTTSTRENIVGLLGLADTQEGTKLCPKLSQSPTGAAFNTHGISYYAYDSGAGASTGDKSAAFALVGNFNAAANKISGLEELNEHSFVAGITVNYSVPDSNNSLIPSEGNFGGIVDKLNGGIIFGAKVGGNLSVGGSEQRKIGGIAATMTNGMISNTYSSVDIVYRAAALGTAAAMVGDVSGNSFIDASYSTGNVRSYISANLYAFANVTDGSSTVRDSYTISWVDQKDHTAKEVSGTAGILAVKKDVSCKTINFVYSADAIELNQTTNENEGGLTYGSVLTTESVNSKKFKTVDTDINFGYPYLNFETFKRSSYVKIGDNGTLNECAKSADNAYYVVFNATLLKNSASLPGTNFVLARDINLVNTSQKGLALGALNFADKTFDGNNHIITRSDSTTDAIATEKEALFNKIATIKNLKVIISDNGAKMNAVVANIVTKEATNISAQGYISETHSDTTRNNLDDTPNDLYESAGGLFAICDAGSQVSHCRNYVKITSQYAVDLGGIVGTANGTVSYSLNYAPIEGKNKTSAKDRWVGGIAGSTTAKIQYCGNENTVFAGYTITGDYNGGAGGIVGYVSATNGAEGKVDNCYNTALVKAGNKKNEGTVYAGGIAGKSQGSITKCSNEAFIEALSENPSYTVGTASNANTNSDDRNLTPKAKVSAISVSSSSGQVYAGTAAGNLQETNQQIGGTAYRNGYYKSINDIFEGKEFTFGNISRNENSFTKDNGWSRYIGTWTDGNSNPHNVEDFYYGYGTGSWENFSETFRTGIVWHLKNYQVRIAEVDSLGIPSKIFIEATREIRYVNNNEYTINQTVFSETIDIGSNGYEAKAIIKNSSTVSSNRPNIFEAIQTAYESLFEQNNERITIGGDSNIYTFMTKGSDFGSIAQQGYTNKEISFTGTISGHNIKDLADAGYNFNVSITSGGIIASGITYDSSGNGKLSFIVAVSTDTAEGGEAVVEYSVTASFPAVHETINIDASTLLLSDDGKTVTIYYTEVVSNQLVEGADFTLDLGSLKPKFTAKAYVEGQPYQMLTYNGEDAQKVFAELLSQGSITININEGKAEYSTTASECVSTGEVTTTSKTFDAVTAKTAWTDVTMFTQALRLNSGNGSTGLLPSGEPTESKRISRSGNIEYSNDNKTVTFDVKILGKVSTIDATTYGNATLFGWNFDLTDTTSYTSIGSTTETKLCHFKLDSTNEDYANVAGDMFIVSSSYDEGSDTTTLKLKLECEESVKKAYSEKGIFTTYDNITMENTFLSGLQLRATFAYRYVDSKQAERLDLNNPQDYQTKRYFTIDGDGKYELTYNVTRQVSNETAPTTSAVSSGTAQGYKYLGTLTYSLQSIEKIENDDNNFGIRVVDDFAWDDNSTDSTKKHIFNDNYQRQTSAQATGDPGNQEIVVRGKRYIVSFDDSKMLVLSTADGDEITGTSQGIDIDGVKYYWSMFVNSDGLIRLNYVYYYDNPTKKLVFSSLPKMTTQTSLSMETNLNWVNGMSTETYYTKFEEMGSVSLEKILLMLNFTDANPQEPIQAKMTGNAGQVTLDGVSYTLTKSTDAEGNTILYVVQGDPVGQLTFNRDNSEALLVIGNTSWIVTMNEEATEFTFTMQGYIGDGGRINIDGQYYLYLIDEDGLATLYDHNGAGTKQTEDNQITVGDVVYHVVRSSQNLLENGYAINMIPPTDNDEKAKQDITFENDNGKVKVTVKFTGGNLPVNTILSISGIPQNSDPNNVSVGLTNYTGEYQMGFTYSSDLHTVTVNGENITAVTNSKLTFPASNQPQEIDIVIESKKELDPKLDTEKIPITSQDSEITSGIVLKNDILSKINTSIILNEGIKIDGNGLAVVFNSSAQALFDIKTGFSGFIKNISVAGTTQDKSILSQEASSDKGTLKKAYNTKVFGSSILTSNNTRYLVAQGLEGEEGLSVSNYASFSSSDRLEQTNDNDVTLCVFGNLTTTTGVTLSNFGTVIGADGQDGTSAGAAGKNGQNVAICASNSTSANNYGILKAGNGGNGARGTEGAPGKDSTNSQTTPTAGIAGGAGGAAGKGGKVDGKIIEDTDGQAGTSGNKGWNGLNLCRYSGSNSGNRFALTQGDNVNVADYNVSYNQQITQTISIRIKVKKAGGTGYGNGVREEWYADGSALEIWFCSSHPQEITTEKQNKDWTVSTRSESKLQILYSTSGTIGTGTASSYYWNGGYSSSSLSWSFYVYYSQTDINNNFSSTTSYYST